jgi:hypothetical protein
LDLDTSPEGRKRKLAFVRKIKKDEVKAIVDLIKALDSNEALVEVNKRMRDLGYKGRITKKTIEV